VKDRELVQCYINQEFKNSNGACAGDKDQGRKLRDMLRKASDYAACRRTQYKDQIVECRAAISGMFKEFLKYEMTSHQEKQAFLTLISNFAHYVLLLKEFKEDGKIPSDPKTKIQNIIEDQIFNMQRKGSGMMPMQHPLLLKPVNPVIGVISTVPKNQVPGVKLQTPVAADHPCDTKTRLDNQAKYLDVQAQNVIDKYDDPHLSHQMNAQGKLIKVIPRQHPAAGFNKYSLRFNDIDDKIARMKHINRGRFKNKAHSEDGDHQENHDVHHVGRFLFFKI
jgi:hypothetical protein